MSWHHIPKDDAWKQPHLAMLVRLGKRAWLHCDDCRHSVMIEAHELAQRHQLDMQIPAAHDLEGDALHTLWGTEGVLLAGAAQHAAGLAISAALGALQRSYAIGTERRC
jgi:hypothetical protein